MILGELLKNVLFVEGNFCRIDLVIKYMGVQTFLKTQTINPLWWRMQFVKLLINKEGRNENIQLQKDRLKWLCDDFKNKVEIRDPIVIGSNFKMGDGSHRLACAMIFNVKEIKVQLLDIPYCGPESIDPLLMELYNPEEREEILRYKEMICKELEVGRWG